MMEHLRDQWRTAAEVPYITREMITEILDAAEEAAAKAAANKGIPFCLSTVPVCSIEEVASQSPQSIWFQLYAEPDRDGAHERVEKALAAGATACSGGRLYLYALAAAGQPGVERIVGKLRDEIDRDMRLMGVKSVAQLNRSMLRYR